MVVFGLSPNKSLTLGTSKIPPFYFADFLRGCLDGDGNISVVRHPESRHPQLRLRFCSASLNHLKWLHSFISKIYGITGGFISKPPGTARYLTYAKSDATKLLELLYYDGVKYFLDRKYKYYSEKMGEW